MNGEFPYSGSSGWAGSGASKDRADHDDSSGRTTERQQRVLAFLSDCTWDGATWREVASRFSMHHGQASGVLSVLHKTGHILRLQERRGRCSVYVMPEFVEDRATAVHGSVRHKVCPNCGTVV